MLSRANARLVMMSFLTRQADPHKKLPLDTLNHTHPFRVVCARAYLYSSMYSSELSSLVCLALAVKPADLAHLVVKPSKPQKTFKSSDLRPLIQSYISNVKTPPQRTKMWIRLQLQLRKYRDTHETAAAAHNKFASFSNIQKLVQRCKQGSSSNAATRLSLRVPPFYKESL